MRAHGDAEIVLQLVRRMAATSDIAERRRLAREARDVLHAGSELVDEEDLAALELASDIAERCANGLRPTAH